MRLLNILLLAFLILGCSSENVDTQIVNPTPEGIYFPPTNSDVWETISITDLGWNTSAEQPLYDLLDATGTKAFIILKDGKIVIERYGNGADATTSLPWNSAAKTLAAFTTGIAQEEGFLNIDDASKQYLGNGWSSLTALQESNITIRNHLTLTTGLDYTDWLNTNCTDPECLTYLNEPSSFWYYHNATYTLLHDIVSGAVGSDFNTYFNEKLKNKIGMQGAWIPFGYFKLYFSNARSVARFGLLNLNKGIWDETPILSDLNYFNAMTNTSQNQNKAYGYLWWLNGKQSYRAPGVTSEFTGELIENAPDDLIAGLGKNDQKMYVIPSQNLVIIRLGNDAGEALLGPSSFDNDLWQKINALIN